ncbi:MAG: hypothetical protein VB012_05750 [Erysipelotrichaceae bacterium]|nr:hypothetical protein [Erysipelotrichaceae bacterium]
MDESLKQLVAVVIAVVVGVFLISYISSDSFKSKITDSIDTKIDSLLYHETISV